MSGNINNLDVSPQHVELAIEKLNGLLDLIDSRFRFDKCHLDSESLLSILNCLDHLVALQVINRETYELLSGFVCENIFELLIKLDVMQPMA